MLFKNLRVHQIFGANTEVGKTLFATALCRTAALAGEASHYLKPVGTGGHGDDWHVSTFSPKTRSRCLHYFDEPVSPHLAAELAKDKDQSYTPPTDIQIASGIKQHAEGVARSLTNGQRGSLIVETAGGPHSPTLIGGSQADAYRPLRLPTVLVASPHLGGISTTISAYESLLLRGYDIEALLCLHEGYYSNWKFFDKWSKEKGLAFGVLHPPPQVAEDRNADVQAMHQYYENILKQDLDDSLSLQSVVRQLNERHEKRHADLQSMPSRTRDSVWWPFVQHTQIKADKDVMVIDSALGDTFSVHKAEESENVNGIVATFDGSASWWTQCLGHANVDLTLAASHAAGRYGHVIFPNATHEPALQLTEKLLDTVGKGWADRVFFSDDGSTGMEVALKMALRATAARLRQSEQTHQGKKTELGVLGLNGSYHGDTIGAMDACEGGVYSATVEWYRGRGFWLDPPLVRIEDGKPVIRFEGEQWEDAAPADHFQQVGEVYDVEGRLQGGDPLVAVYKQHIQKLVTQAQQELGLTFGALVLEPIVMGAGGMLFVDPLFQRLLVDHVRTETSLQLPVIFDEVFVGLYRLGQPTGHSLLDVKPDIACFAKILTGGLVPMAVTLASERIFGNFLGEKKQDALLHGHSYTAHPIGCAVANKTLELISKLDESNSTWASSRSKWSREPSPLAGHIWSLWDKDFVDRVSQLAQVDGAMAMGSVLVIYLKDTQNAGYQSTASAGFLSRLRYPEAGSDLLPIHSRPLGNTVYWMSSLNTPSYNLRAVEKAIWTALTVE